MPAEAVLAGSMRRATKGWEHRGKEGPCLSPCSGSAQHHTCLFPCLEYKFTATRSQGLPAKEDLFRLEENRAENSLSVPRTPPPSYTLLSQAHQGRGKSLQALLPTSLPPQGPAGSQSSGFTRRTVQSHILGTSPAPDFPMHSPRATRTREMSTATKGLRAGGAGHQHGSAWSHGEKEGGTGGSRTRPDILRGQQQDAKVTAWGHGAGRRWRVLPVHRGSFPEKELYVPAGNHRAGGNVSHLHGHPEEAPSSRAARGEATPRPRLRGSPFACGQTPLTWS